MTSPNGQPSDADLSQLGFEDAYRQLTEIAEGLESGGLTLAEATQRYEQGMKLVRHCNNLLDSAELQITTLRESDQNPVPPAAYIDDSGPAFRVLTEDEENYEEETYEEDTLPF